MFSDTSDKDLNNTDGWCVSVEAGKDLPTHVDSWKIEEEEHAPMKCISSHSTNFIEKAQLAEKAGALALVVINR
jgi:hypothetical protein